MQLPRKETIAALEPVKAAVASSNETIVQKSHLWFDGEHAFATDGGLGVKVKFVSPVKCGVPGTLFFGLLGQIAADTLQFDYADDVIKFKAGRSSVKLHTLPLEQGQKIWRFPEAPSGKPLASIKVTEAFIAGLKRVLALKPTEKKQMEHHAVCIFDVDGEAMDLYTTDYPRSLVVVGVEEKITGSAKKLALPRVLASQIVVHCTPGKTLKMYADHFVVQASADVTLYSNVFDATEMMDMPQFAERYSNDKVSVPVPIPDGLTAALERAVLLSGSEEPSVDLVTNGKSLKFSGGFKLGSIAETFELEKSAAKAVITVDAKTFLSVKDVTKLAIFDGAALALRDGEGFMYMMSAKAAPKKTESEPEQSVEDDDTPAREKRGKGRKVAADADDDIPF